MEVVIAIGVVAFAIPMFLALSKSAGDSRLSAEADTRSTWLAREVHRELIAAWANPLRTTAFGEEIDFPAFANVTEPEILAYDSEGNFIAKGGIEGLNVRSNIPNATYLVAIHGEAHLPPNAVTDSRNLSLITIRIFHPAKASPDHRTEFRYKLISTRTNSP